MEIREIEVIINYKFEDIIRIYTDLINPYDDNANVSFDIEVHKNQGLKYVYDKILPGCRQKPKLTVIDYKIRKLVYEIPL